MYAERLGVLAHTYNPRRLKQVDCQEIENEGSLGYKVNARLAWAIE